MVKFGDKVTILNKKSVPPSIRNKKSVVTGRQGRGIIVTLRGNDRKFIMEHEIKKGW